MLCTFFPAVPSSSPRNVTVVEISPYSISLTWTPPASEHQNGIITRYIINVTVVETGGMFQLFSNATTVTAVLLPFTVYTFVLTAENSIGTGPFSELLSIQSDEAGRVLLWYLNNYDHNINARYNLYLVSSPCMVCK